MILRAVERAWEVQAQESHAQQTEPLKKDALGAPDALGKAGAAETAGVSAVMLSSELC